MNQVFLIGNLTRDPEHRTTNGGISTCSFTLAVEREQSKKDRESGNKVTDYITIITWRNTADLCARYLTKGRQVAVRGSWHNRNYEDKDGNKRTVSECIADEVKFLGAPPQRDDSADDEYPPYR
ncbi:single-stranded DNA-binding protein [Desulfitobacterium sp.]|uniref:single-stranded DNA-binding protein n=1 Tax=Desulfitobacterium sp. TaxID=49981 RepID=UPI002B207997|nr:single-stranded DNA-binding protein [Desulfitobacterium sp.]MEA4901869.1 single-stranded DNA-binding protein [Desulfitobacterium sp.]